MGRLESGGDGCLGVWKQIWASDFIWLRVGPKVSQVPLLIGN